MGLFRRKQSTEEDVERCPYCRERLPEGANRCQMCGAALEPLRVVGRDEHTATPRGRP
jgi:predicted amidophosphoribosyltransferase